MSSYFIQQIKPLSAVDKGLYLVILHADVVPPHLGLIYEQKYFSLTVNGQTLGDDVVVLEKLILRKQIKTLFFKLTEKQNILGKIKKVFEEKNRVEGEITCLYPIKMLFSELYADTIASARFIYEVLPELYMSNNVKAVFHSNMENEIIDDTFAFQKYTMDDILSRIQSYETDGVC
ncbi:MAG: hypothetical protein JKY53_01495 [Flavobacteriales bacterium]|nr:hypothetical protein [Flavobacteriales bacterium]